MTATYLSTTKLQSGEIFGHPRDTFLYKCCHSSLSTFLGGLRSIVHRAKFNFQETIGSVLAMVARASNKIGLQVDTCIAGNGLVFL